MLFEPVLIVLIRGLHLLMNIWQAKMHLNPLSGFLGVAHDKERAFRVVPLEELLEYYEKD